VGAQNGRETVVRALFELGADINEARDLGATPLFIGAIQGTEAVVRALIEVGADVNKANDIGGSPLSASTTPISNVARGNHAAIVQLLRDAGAV
jgi:cytohesin